MHCPLSLTNINLLTRLFPLRYASLDFNIFYFEMDLNYGQINLGLMLNLDIEAQKETEVHYRLKVNKLKIATRFYYIIFGIYIYIKIFLITLAIYFILRCLPFSIDNLYKYHFKWFVLIIS